MMGALSVATAKGKGRSDFLHMHRHVSSVHVHFDIGPHAVRTASDHWTSLPLRTLDTHRSFRALDIPTAQDTGHLSESALALLVCHLSESAVCVVVAPRAFGRIQCPTGKSAAMPTQARVWIPPRLRTM